MKHLLTGVAIAAALAISAPAWAQNTPGPKASGGGSQTSTPMKPAAAAPAKPMAAKPAAAHKMAMHHRMVHHHHMMAGRQDTATEELNKQELARIQGGGGGAPAGASMPGPRPSPQH